MINGTPSSETVDTVASGLRNISAKSVGEARLPTVSCGFGIRAKLMPSPSKIEIVQSLFGRCLSMMFWNISIGGLNEMTWATSPFLMTGTSTVTMCCFLTASMNRLE